MARKVFEKTFGTRFQNAKTLLTLLGTFQNFKPIHPDDDLVSVGKLIDSIQTSNNQEASALQTYTLAIDARKKIFYDKDNGIRAIVTSIIAALRAQYGKESKQVSSLTELINKIRGVTKTVQKEDGETKRVSSSQLSYASIMQNFSDLIASLSAIQPAYSPINPTVTVEELSKLLESARENSEKASLSNIQLKQAREARNKYYEDLTIRTQRLKEGVKAIYGTRSQEYTSIKGLKI
jgi:hypothetical protein